MNMNLELEKFNNFIDSLNTEEFENMLERAGINEMQSCEDFDMEYYKERE